MLVYGQYQATCHECNIWHCLCLLLEEAAVKLAQKYLSVSVLHSFEFLPSPLIVGFIGGCLCRCSRKVPLWIVTLQRDSQCKSTKFILLKQSYLEIMEHWLHIPTVRQIVGHLGWRMRPIQGVCIHTTGNTWTVISVPSGIQIYDHKFYWRKNIYFFCFMFFLSVLLDSPPKISYVFFSSIHLWMDGTWN
jgi:hypothetical protein